MQGFHKSERNLEWFLSRFRSEEPVTFSRWGDGEWRAVLGKRHGSNCDDHPFTPALTKELSDVLIAKPEYPLGMQNLAMRLFGEQIRDWLLRRDCHMVWSEADVFHKAAGSHGLDYICQKGLAGRKMLIVGDSHLARIVTEDIWKKMLLKDCVHVDCHGTLVFDHRAEVLADVQGFLRNVDHEHWIVSLCMGMTAEITLHELHKEFGQKHSLVDFGSLWDPIVNVDSRNYMRRARKKERDDA